MAENMNDYSNYIYPGTNVSLRDVQEVEFEILVEFDRICKEEKIPYQLFAGTLLGAVRHHDFIPWDDDIDVCMMRDDFERFIEVCPKHLDKKYFLQTHRTDPKSVVQFAKIRKNGTVFENNVDNLPDTNTGIWIDIFPLDKTKHGTIAEKVQYFEVTVLYAMITSTVKSRVSVSQKPWKKILRTAFYGITKVIPKHALESRLNKVMTRYNNADTGYVGNYANGTGWSYTAHVRKTEGFYNIIETEFHGQRFPIPQNYDEVLTNSYGDYMKFPPEEKRQPTHGITRVVI